MNKCWCVVLLCTSAVFTEIFMQGTVVDAMDQPIGNADVAVMDLSDQTDANGEFLIAGDAVDALSPILLRRSMPFVAFDKYAITLRNPQRQRAQALLINAQGKVIDLLEKNSDAHAKLITAHLPRSRIPASGLYIARISIGAQTFTSKCMVMGSDISWNNSFATPAGAAAYAVAKAQGSWVLDASAAGYDDRRISLKQDTIIGLVVTLYQQGVTRPQAVTVIESTETVTFRLGHYSGDSSSFAWANGSKLKTYFDVDFTILDSDSTTVTKAFNVIHLDNGLIRITAAPDLGMRILRVLDKTVTPHRQMFEQYTDPANPGRFTQNIGGIKPSFPFYENSTGMIDYDGTFDCKAGHFLEHRGDGSVRLIMNLRFDYHQREQDAGFTGRYGDRPLTCVVSLKPGHSDFDVRYIAENHNPLRRNDRIWNVAQYPDPYAAGGQWIFPTKYAVHHCAGDLWNMTSNGPLTDNNPIRQEGSYFALYPKYSFFGTFYQTADASHLRISDPVKYPAAKIYHHKNDKPPFELWGGTNAVFEAPEGFVNAFEPNDLVQKYYLARNIGLVDFANEYVAVAIDNNSFRLTSPAPMIVTVYEYNQSSSPILTDERIGPGLDISGQFTDGLRVVSGGRELCNFEYPLTYVDNASLRDDVVTMATLSGCYSSLPIDASRGYNYELEHIQVKHFNPFISSLASLLAIENVSAGDNEAILTSMARTAYRLGGFSVVNDYLSLTGQGQSEQKNLLTALMSLENGTVADFSSTPIEANYFKALDHVKQGRNTQAISQLDELLTQRPNAIRPRLLRAYLKEDLSDALYVYERVPGSIELWATLRELGYPGATQILTGLTAQSGDMGVVARQNFLNELENGIWRHERRFEYDRNWFAKVDLPAFPDTLKY
ncbi:MAG: hypothetical protein GF398_05690 [Chitinivibrionales bacterium]|nr:hypothetical protein [Chitinivibrionales bacterium]